MIIIPTDELHHFSEGLVYHQPDDSNMIFIFPSYMGCHPSH